MANIASIIPFTYKWEGGLSRATSDTASAHPSPFTIVDPKDGKPKNGWHTNKGVTYAAFKDASAKYGFDNNAKNFASMPEDIWLKIAKGSYWDKLYLDNVKSQAIANVLFSLIWGSWLNWTGRMQKYLKTKGVDWNKTNLKALPDIINAQVAKYGEKQVLDDIIELKKGYLLALNQPQNEKGWLNRLDALKDYSYSLLGSSVKQIEKTLEEVKKKPVITIVVTTILIVSTFILIQTLKKTKLT